MARLKQNGFGAWKFGVVVSGSKCGLLIWPAILFFLALVGCGGLEVWYMVHDV